MISIWFFIGLSLLVNGLLIFGAGLYDWAHPPADAQKVQLWGLHANAWWGALMTMIGAAYCYFFKPGKKKA